MKPMTDIKKTFAKFQRDIVEGGANAKSWSGPLEAIDAAITKAEGEQK